MNTKSSVLPFAAIALALPVLLAAGCSSPSAEGTSVKAAPQAAKTAAPSAEKAPGRSSLVDFKTADKAFQQAGRNRRTPISEVSNAYARVLSATNLTDAARARALVDFGTFHNRRSLLDPALACFEVAFASENAEPATRVAAISEAGKALSDANFRGGYATYEHGDLDRAAKTYLRVLDVEGATGLEKITALRAAAWAMLDSKQDVDPEAEKLLVKATKLPGLDEVERARAQVNLADYYIESLQPAKALPILAPLAVQAREKKFHVHFCGDILWSYADAMALSDGFDKTLAMMTEGVGKGHYGMRGVANFCQANERPDLAVKFLRQDIPGPDAKPSSRLWYMRLRLFGPYTQLGFPAFRAFIEKDVLPILRDNPDEWKEVLLALNKTTFGAGGGTQTQGYHQWLLALAKMAPAGKGMPAPEMLALATRCRDLDQAAAAAKEILEPGDPKAKSYQAAGLTLAVIESRDSEAAVAKISSFLDKCAVKDAKARGEATLEAARIAMAFRHEKSARSLYEAYGKMIVPVEKPSLDCLFVPDAPQDISAIMASDFYRKAPKGKLDKKFGEHLQFLLDTDSAVTGRKVVDGKDGVPVPELFTFCDVFGVKFLIKAYMSKEEIANMKNGFGGAASYEAYLAPGIDSPYEFLFLDPPSNYGDDDTGFITQYDNGNGYRNLKPSDDQINVSYQIREDSVVTMISVDWAPYFNSLPVDGSEWFFEPIIWTRGGLSWGGSESVHHRSSFGRVVFGNLTRANQVAIKRRLLNGALRSYRNAKSPRRNVQIEIWKDNELGDQDFYARCVKPLCDRLDPYERMIKASMTDEEVELVYEKAARTWYNIDYVIWQLRRDYLDEKLTSEE